MKWWLEYSTLKLRTRMIFLHKYCIYLTEHRGIYYFQKLFCYGVYLKVAFI